MKGNGLIFYQNLWHSPKLTKKGQKWAKMKAKVYSTEQGRPVLKQNLFKRISPETGAKFGQKRPISPAFFQSVALPKGGYSNSNSTQKAVLQPSENAIIFSGCQNQVEVAKKALFEKKYRKTGVERKKAQNQITKRFWFFDTAAPIPGVSSLKKRKILFRAKQRASQTIQSWLQILTKKQMKKFFRTFPIQKMKMSQKWTPFMQMDSMYQSVFRKTAFTLNAHESNALLFSQKRTVNGNFGKKIRTFSGIGDLFLLTNTTPYSLLSKSSLQKRETFLGLHKLESFYAKKSPIFQNLSFLFIFCMGFKFSTLLGGYQHKTEQKQFI